MNRISLLLFFLFFQLTFSQKKYNASNLAVSYSDVENKIYKLDSTANAFFIYEKGFTRIEENEDYNLVTDYEAKLKIINPQGYSYANIEIQLYKDEKVKRIVAKTYNLINGEIKVSKLTKDQIFETKEDEKRTSVNFALPNIKEGSVITYSYQLISPHKYRFKNWEFQDDIPKLHSEYITDILGNYHYNARIVGKLKLKQKKPYVIKNCVESGDNVGACVHSEYSMDSIPAFKDQKYLTSRKNYLSAIKYELSSFTDVYGKKTNYSKTWKTAEEDLKKDYGFGQQLKKMRLANQTLEENISKKPLSLNYAKEIFSYAKNNFKWDEKYFYFKSIDLKENFKKKRGNVAEINMILHNLLKSQGFEVYPVLLSTRKNGYPVKIHPVVSEFNYLIVKIIVEGKMYLLDATDKLLSFGELPFRCLNDEGRVLKFKEIGEWESLLPEKRVSKVILDKITINEEGELEGSLSEIYEKQEALDMRKQLENKSIEEILEESNIEIDNVNIENEIEVENPLKITYTYTKETLRVDDTILFNPFSLLLLTTNPFIEEERLYPIDYGYKRNYIYNVIIQIPDNYEFKDIPENIALALQDKGGKLFVNYALKGKKLNVMFRFDLNKTFFSAEYYPVLKEVYRIIVNQNKELVSIQRKQVTK